MEIEMGLKELVDELLHEYGTGNRALFQLRHKFMLNISLSNKSPYLEKARLNKKYVGECLAKATEVLKHMGMTKKVLIVFENKYGDKKLDLEGKNFLETTFVDIIDHETDSFNWHFPHDDAVYKCHRYIYYVEGFREEKLFRQIILSNIGGSLDFSSAISIIDLNNRRVFHLYDDRGLYVLAPNEALLTKLWDKFRHSIFRDYNNFKIDLLSIEKLEEIKDGSHGFCIYGDILVTIGEEEFSYSCITNTRVTNLLQTLDEDYVSVQGEKMHPRFCTALSPKKKTDPSKPEECAKGMDWTVIHENGMVKLITLRGRVVVIYYLQYKKEIIAFVNKIEGYYKGAIEDNKIEG